jgi:uncharacterized protein (DUF2147 family)
MKQTIAFLFTALAIALIQFPALADDSADAILGDWHTTGNKSVVKIIKRDGHYFGQIVSLGKPNWPVDDKLGMGGKPRNDRKNPDPALRDRPIVGLEIVSGFSYAGKNRWADGKVYDPESGKTYSGKMTLLPDNHLELRGFIGISLIGRSVTWTR